MGITVQWLDGPKAGRAEEFGADGGEIRFGRDPAFAQVLFPPDVGGVSRRHMTLVPAPDGYRIQLHSDFPLLVDGQPVPDGTAISGPCEVQFGDGGPRIQVTLAGATIPAGAAPPIQGRTGTRTMLIRMQARVKRHQGITAVAIVAVLVMAVGGFFVVRELATKAGKKADQAQETADEATDTADKAAESIAGAKADLNSMLGKLAAQQEDVAQAIEREKQRMQDAMEEARADEDKRRKAERKRFEKELEKLKKNAQRPDAAWEKTIRRVSPSVYMVGRLTGNEYRGGGTAWVVGPGVLATNSHVAAQFAQNGGKLWIRSSDKDPRTLRITKVLMHPTYGWWIRNGLKYASIVPQTGRLDDRFFMTRCDVALLYVEPSQASQLGPPFKLAGPDVLRGLTAGKPVAFVGFPVERLMGGGTDTARPVPTTQVGRITAVRDYMLARAPYDEQLDIEFSMPAAGGASGSPIFNEAGEVVSVLSGGNIHIDTRSGGRVPLAVGVNFSQRSDLVAELLNGQYPRFHKQRMAQWAPRYAEAKRKKFDAFAHLRADGAAGVLLRSKMVSSGRWKKIKVLQGTLRAPKQPVTLTFDAPSKGYYLVVGTTDHPVVLYMTAPGRNVVDTFSAADRAKMVKWGHHTMFEMGGTCLALADRGHKVNVQVSCVRSRFSGLSMLPVRCTVRVFHIQ